MMNPFNLPKATDAKKVGESKWGYAMLLMAGLTVGSLAAFFIMGGKASSSRDDCEEKYQKLVEKVFINKGVINDPSAMVTDSAAFWKARADSVKNLMNQLMQNKEIIKK